MYNATPILKIHVPSFLLLRVNCNYEKGIYMDDLLSQLCTTE